MSTPVVATNLTDGAGLTRTYDGLTLREQGTVVANVSQLTDGSSNQQQTAISRALQAVQAKYPAYAPIAGLTTVGVVMGYRAIGYSTSDDSVRVAISIDTPTVNITPTFVLSDTTSVVPGKTQILRRSNPTDIVQLVILATVPPAIAAKAGQFTGGGSSRNKVGAGLANGMTKQYVATIDYDETIRKIVFNAVLLRQNFARIRAAVRTVNDSPYLGLGTAFWKFDIFHSETVDLGATYKIQAEISSAVDHDWSKYAVLKDRNNGQYVACAQADLKDAESQPYKWGYMYGQSVNLGFLGVFGIGPGANKPFIRVGPYTTSNFNTLFALPSAFKG